MTTPYDPGLRNGAGIAGIPRVPILGANVSVSTFNDATEAVAHLVARRGGSYVSSGNAYSSTMALADADFRSAVNGAEYVTADGVPVVWALRSLGYTAERVHTDDLCFSCCARYRHWRHFFLGGRTDQPEAVARAMEDRFEGIRIVGTHATPHRPVPDAETEAILGEIRNAEADIVWVGMGTPAQDFWMLENAGRAGVPMVGVGSSFDLLAGRTRPTPGWMKRSGLQWFFRLCQEPRRLAFRYAYHNSWFILAFARQFVRHKTGRR